MPQHSESAPHTQQWYLTGKEWENSDVPIGFSQAGPFKASNISDVPINPSQAEPSRTTTSTHEKPKMSDMLLHALEQLEEAFASNFEAAQTSCLAASEAATVAEANCEKAVATCNMVQKVINDIGVVGKE